MRPDTPSHEGCPHCCRGHAPTWQYAPAPGEWVHVIQVRSADEKTTNVAVVVCTAANNPSK